MDGWVERSRLVGRRVECWLERTVDSATGRVEYVFPDGSPVPSTADVAAVRESRISLAATNRPDAVAPSVLLCERPSALVVTVRDGALRTIREETWNNSPAIEQELQETGGGIFGPPLRSWTKQAEVVLANVAAASRGRNRMQIAYGEIEATEANLIRCHDSEFRRIGDWHVHPGRGATGRPSDTDMRTWLSELDEIDRQRPVGQYLGIIATVGERGWTSRPRLHAWVVRRNSRGEPICEPATLGERRRARAA